MAGKFPLLLLVLLTGCAQSPPAPLAADRARVALESNTRADMRAYRVDGELVRQLRFPDLEPGQHQLQVRYQFEIPGGMGGFGEVSEPRRRSCILGVEWALVGGQEYRFTAYRLGWQPVGWLESAAGERLARAEVIRCGPGA